MYSIVVENLAINSRQAQNVLSFYHVSPKHWRLGNIAAVLPKPLAMLAVVILVLIPWNTAW